MLTDNIYADYNLDGNSNDGVGSNDGVDTNISYSASYGKIGQGALLGSGKAIAIPTSIGAGDKTYSFWIYCTSVNAGVVNWIFGDWNNTVWNFLLYLATNGNIIFEYRNSTNTATLQNTSAGAISLNTWYHIVMVRTSSTVKLYINGSQVGSTANSNNPNVAGTISIGSASDPFNGYFDIIDMWQRALSEAEITELYNLGAGKQYPFTTADGKGFLNFFK
jgi:hypothetical protein